MDILGKTVNFVRQNKEGEIVTGSGTVRAVSLNIDNELQYLVQTETDGGFNIFPACINPSEEFIAKFRELQIESDRLTKEGNAKITHIRNHYELRLRETRQALLGRAQTIEDSTVH